MRRHLPFAKQFWLYVNGGVGVLPMMFLVFGSFFIFLTVDQVNIDELFYLGRNASLGNGEITAITATNTSIHEERIYKYDFVFYSPVGDLEGSSFDVINKHKVGDEVEIEYNQTHPDVNRIKGMSNTVGGIFYLYVTIPFLIGFFWLLFSFIKGLKKYRLLKLGNITKANFESKNETSIRINKKPVFQFIFSFTDKYGDKHSIKSSTNNPGKFESNNELLVVYNPINPNRSLLIDSLPYGVASYIKKNWL